MYGVCIICIYYGIVGKELHGCRPNPTDTLAPVPNKSLHTYILLFIDSLYNVKSLTLKYLYIQAQTRTFHIHSYGIENPSVCTCTPNWYHKPRIPFSSFSRGLQLFHDKKGPCVGS